MADPVNLADEFAPPDTKAAPVDIASEFEAPPTQEQHAVINDATDKAHQWRTAKTSEERLALVTDWFSRKGVDVALKNAGEFLSHNWEKENEPLVNVPKIPNTTAVEALSAGNPQFRLLTGVYNGLAPIASSLTSPLNIETLGTFGALQKASQLAGAAGTAAKAALNSIKLYFGAQMAKGAGEAAGAASVDPSIENVTTALASSALAILGGHAAAEGLAGKEAVSAPAGPDAFEGKFEPQGPKQPKGSDSTPVSEARPAEAAPTPPAPETVATAAVKLADGTVHTGKTHGQIVGELGDADLTGADDGFVTSTGRYVTREEGMKIAKASAQMDDSNQGPDRLYSEHLDPNQSRPPVKAAATPADPVLAQVFHVEQLDGPAFQKFADDQTEGGFTARAHELGISAIDHPEAKQALRDAADKNSVAFKAAMAADDLDGASVLASKQQFFNEALGAAENTGSAAGEATVKAAHAPDLAAEFTPPAESTPEHAAITEELAQPPAPPVELAKDVTPPPDGATGIKNAIVDQERESRGLPPAMEAAKHSFGEAWDEASAKLNRNPNAGFELVKDLNDHPRAIGDADDALLLRHQIDLQNQFDKLAERITEGSEGGTPETLAEDKVQLALLSDHLLEAYDANRKAGTETGRGLNARKMLANEDFSLAKMVTRKRAVNGGKELTPEDLAEVQALHEKIAQTQKAFDDYVAQQRPRAARRVVVRDNPISRLMTDRANEARARIAARLEKAFTAQAVEGEQNGGLLSKENLQDFATVAADYLAKGVDAGAELVKEFGERIKPHVEEILAKARAVFEDTSIDAALAAKKDRLERSIAELSRKVEEGDTSTPGEKTNRPSLPEVEALEQRRDALREELNSIRKTEAKVLELNEAIAEKERKLAEGDLAPKGEPVNRPAPEAIERLKLERDGLNMDLAKARRESGKATDSELIQGRLDSINEEIAEKKKALEAGDIAPKGQAVNRPAIPELEQAKQELDAVNRQLDIARKPVPKTETEKQAANLDRQIAELERQIASGEIFPKGKAPKDVNPALKEKQARLDQLKYERENMRETVQPSADPAIPRTPEEARMAAAKTRLERSTADYEQRLDEENFDPRDRAEPIRLDDEGLRLKAENERAKQDFQTALIRDQLENRTPLEKAQDTFVKWRRGFLLSGPITLAKLSAAAVERGVFTPLEEAVGTLLPSALKGNAPRQGGLSVRAEAKAITTAFTKGMADAVKTIKTGKSDLDVLYGHGLTGNVRVSDVVPRSVIDFFGSLHGALKAPVKRAEFERSLQKRTEYAIRQGVDVSDPMVQTRLAVESYKDANRAIFMQDNVVTNAWNAGLRLLEAKQKETGRPSVPGKLISTTLRTLLPIVKVPTNIVAETFETATGLVTGSAKLAFAMRKGLENLTPEQSDVIARELKKGSLGAAVIALGYFNADTVGGYYQQGEKRKPTDAKAGSIRVFGQNVPSFLLHNPLLETLQLGATIRRVADAKVKGTKNGLATGVWTSALGLTEELPFVRTPIELAKVFDPKERTYAEGELAKGFLIPQALDFVARETDTKANGDPQKRKPATVLQHIETGIPGLRQTVPKRN